MEMAIIEIGDPKVEKLAFMSWIGNQKINRTSADGKMGSTQILTVWARTRGGAYKKLAKRQEQETGKSRRPVRQVAKGGHGSVQIQSGGDVRFDTHANQALDRMGARFDRGEVPYDPALDWPNRYPDGGQ